MSVPIKEDFVPQSPVSFAWLSRAWELFTARPGVWVSACLLYFLISIGLWILWAIPTGTLATMQQTFRAMMNHTVPAASIQNPYLQFAQEQVMSVILTGINVIFYAGFYRMALRQSSGERISILGLFSGFSQALSLFIVGFILAALITLLESLCLLLLHLLGVTAPKATSYSTNIGLVFSFVFEGLLMFAPLLILDRKLAVVEALMGSVRLLHKQRIKSVWFYFVASMVGGLGVLLCGVGLLATYPVFLISIAVGYQAMTETPSVPSSPYGPPQVGVWPPPPVFDTK